MQHRIKSYNEYYKNESSMSDSEIVLKFVLTEFETFINKNYANVIIEKYYNADMEKDSFVDVRGFLQKNKFFTLHMLVHGDVLFLEQDYPHTNYCFLSFRRTIVDDFRKKGKFSQELFAHLKREIDFLLAYSFQQMIETWQLDPNEDIPKDKRDIIKEIADSYPSIMSLILDTIWNYAKNRASVLEEQIKRINQDKDYGFDDSGYSYESKASGVRKRIGYVKKVYMKECFFNITVLHKLKQMNPDLYASAIRIEWSPVMLNEIKKLNSDIYSDIRELRAEEKRWKTDAAAEMGDLGFD